MRKRISGHGRWVALLIVGVLIGSALITPVGAHVGGSVAHLWNQHIKPKATQLFYTKQQSNSRIPQQVVHPETWANPDGNLRHGWSRRNVSPHCHPVLSEAFGCISPWRTDT